MTGPEKEQETSVKTANKRSILRFLSGNLISLGLIALSPLVLLAYVFGDAFWLWMQRSFEVAFIFYTIAVIYGIYRYLPLFAAALTGGFMEALNGIFKSQYFRGLGEKGVEAKGFLDALPNAEGGMIKGILSGVAEGFVKERWGSKAAQRVIAAIEMIPVDLDQAVWQNLPQIIEGIGGKFFPDRVEQLKGLAEEFKMLGKVAPK